MSSPLGRVSSRREDRRPRTAPASLASSSAAEICDRPLYVSSIDRIDGRSVGFLPSDLPICRRFEVSRLRPLWFARWRTNGARVTCDRRHSCRHWHRLESNHRVARGFLTAVPVSLFFNLTNDASFDQPLSPRFYRKFYILSLLSFSSVCLFVCFSLQAM